MTGAGHSSSFCLPIFLILAQHIALYCKQYRVKSKEVAAQQVAVTDFSDSFCEMNVRSLETVDA
jgi:hypothetical protein